MYVPGPARYPRILVYHEISQQFHLGINSISPHRFRSHLDFLIKTKTDLIRLKGLNDRSPEKAVCLTFDDGYLSFYDEVLPTLLEYKIPATLFIITNYIGCSNDWDVTFCLNKRHHLDWAKIEEISRCGVEIGSHGRTHRDLTRLPIEVVRDEIRSSKQILEDHLGKEITSFALPFGAVTLDVFLSARESGYIEICGGVPGFHGPFPGVLPRMPVYRGDAERALVRKLEMNLFEVCRLSILQSCSIGTRWLKSRKTRP